LYDCSGTNAPSNLYLEPVYDLDEDCDIVAINLVRSDGTENDLTAIWSSDKPFTINGNKIYVQHAGEYNVTVTDPDCATYINTFPVVEYNNPIRVPEYPHVMMASCNGDGKVRVYRGFAQGLQQYVVSGGQGPYEIQWLDDQGIDIPSISNGAFSEITLNGEQQVTLVVTDAKGCVKEITYDVVSNRTPYIIGAQVEHICGPGDEGSIDLSEMYEHPLNYPQDLSFAWSHGGSVEEIDELSSGVYTVTVTNIESGCSATATYEILDISGTQQLQITVVPLPACGVDGEAEIILSGSATEGARVRVNGRVINGTTLSRLAVGEHLVQVWDNCNNYHEETFEIENQLQASVNLSGECEGSADATIEIEGIYPPYEVRWSHDNSSEVSRSSLGPGAYNVWVSDAAGCTRLVQFWVEPPMNYEITKSQLCVIVDADDDVIEDVTLTTRGDGGSGASYYTLWSNGHVGRNLIVKEAGYYSCTLTDSRSGCTFECAPVYVDIAEELSVDFTIDPQCGSYSGATLSAIRTGGKDPVSYTWNGIASDGWDSFTGLQGSEIFVRMARGPVTLSSVDACDQHDFTGKDLICDELCDWESCLQVLQPPSRRRLCWDWCPPAGDFELSCDKFNFRTDCDIEFNIVSYDNFSFEDENGSGVALDPNSSTAVGIVKSAGPFPKKIYFRVESGRCFKWYSEDIPRKCNSLWDVIGIIGEKFKGGGPYVFPGGGDDNDDEYNDCVDFGIGREYVFDQETCTSQELCGGEVVHSTPSPLERCSSCRFRGENNEIFECRLIERCCNPETSYCCNKNVGPYMDARDFIDMYPGLRLSCNDETPCRPSSDKSSSDPSYFTCNEIIQKIVVVDSSTVGVVVDDTTNHQTTLRNYSIINDTITDTAIEYDTLYDIEYLFDSLSMIETTYNGKVGCEIYHEYRDDSVFVDTTYRSRYVPLGFTQEFVGDSRVYTFYGRDTTVGTPIIYYRTYPDGTPADSGTLEILYDTMTSVFFTSTEEYSVVRRLSTSTRVTSRTTSSTKVIDIPAVANVTGGTRHDSTLYLLIATVQSVSIAGVVLPATDYLSTYLVQFNDDLEVMDWISYTSDTAHIIANLLEFQKECTPIVAGKLSTKDNFQSITDGPFDCSWIGTRHFGCEELEPYSIKNQPPGTARIGVYPNPFSADIELSGLDLLNHYYQMELYDVTGQKILSRAVDKVLLSIPSSVSTGLLYYKIIREDGQVYHGKLFKI
jgi:hypothetical protein